MTFEFDLFATLLLPLLIMIAKIVEVTMGTLRIMFISKGIRIAAVCVGFFEVLIWIAAIGQVMQNLSNVTNYFAYDIGFSIGNYTGMVLEQKLSIGYILVRIITKHDATDLVESMRTQGYQVTDTDATGNLGHVKVIFTVVRRKKLDKVVQIIKKFNPKAFYTIEDMRFVSEDALPNNIASKTFFSKRK